MELDFIVIGQGIAGSLLSYRLIKAGAKVLVVDNGNLNATKVAAGMFNPLTGRKLSLSWNVPYFLEKADELYKELENESGEKFYFPLPITRLFINETDYNIANEAAQKNGALKYLKHFCDRVDMEGIKPGAGLCEIKDGGFVSTKEMLSAVKNFLVKNNAFTEEEFSYDDIEITPNGVNWKSFSAKQIVFCEGYKAVNNPYFNWLPFNVSKGDVFTIYAPDLNLENIINKGAYIVPLKNGYYKVGSTYKWETLDEKPDYDGYVSLKLELDKILDVPYEIIEHEAGIRPTVKQRRPYLGIHPQYKQLAIFNGLGTKGILLAPALSQQMAELLLNNVEPDKEVSISAYPYIAG